jgi:glycosyltransferase involved in cell wall biosynthesis
MIESTLNPAISIVMPFYNREEYLKESINSILNQTFKDFELIAINDGSTDDSLKIIDLYNDKRIRVINNTHDFIKSLNIGVAESKGKYIARMDSDDIMLENRLEIQYNFMENNPEVDICGSWMEIFDNAQNIIKTPATHNEILNMFFYRNPMCHPTILMRKESLKHYKKYPDIYLPDYIYAEDYKLWLDLLKNGLGFANIPIPLVRYRVSKSQSTYKYKEESIEKSHLIIKQYLKFMTETIIKYDRNLFEYINKSTSLLNDGKISINTYKEIIRELSFLNDTQE